MAIADDVRKCVVFIGHGPEEAFQAHGTAFLLHYDGSNYLVSNRHVAQDFGEDPFAIRINRLDGTSDTFQHDPVMHSVAWFRWYFPTDPTADVAVIPFNVHSRDMGLDVRALQGSQWILDEAKFREERIGCGDLCYAVGLFRRVQGARRNVPIIHTGHIALVAGEERVEVEDWNCRGKVVAIHAHLVEMANLKGLSGAPVFVRGEFELEALASFPGEERKVLLPESKLYLLGVWQGSWETADERGERIPVGMGTVVPASDLLALLEQPEVVAERARFNAAVSHENAAKPDTKPAA